MQVNDIKVTKVPERIIQKTPTGLKPLCKTLKVGEALPVKTLGWAVNLKAQLNESTGFSYEYWTEPQMSVHAYKKLSDLQKKSVKVFIGRIA